jgi:hypothetical protein
MRIRIIGEGMPGSTCGPHSHVHVGIQRGKEPDQLAPGDAERVVFEFDVTPVRTPEGWDFRGPYVQGRRGERFFYLTWGELPPGGQFAMFRRAKLYFADLDPAAGSRFEAHIGMTDGQGMPVCASVRPPRVTWQIGGASTQSD